MVCYGDAEVTGKVGTDIEDSKCTWLVCTALATAAPEQERALREAYIAADATSEAGGAAVARGPQPIPATLSRVPPFEIELGACLAQLALARFDLCDF